MSMKTRSQHGSDNEISDGNPPTPPEITVDNSATAPVIASIEVDETSQAFTDALDRILFKDNLKYNGKIICFFNNGKISLFQNVVNGIPNGNFYSSYGNGNIKYEREVDNGKEIYYKAFYENGKIHFIRDGIKNSFTEWDENGKLIK